MAYMIGSARERYFFYNTLACLLKALEGQETVIDLRDDSLVSGTILAVDGFMNVTFSDAVFSDARGNEYLFDSLFINARKIRYVHIPESMPIVTTVKQQLKKMRPKSCADVQLEEKGNIKKSLKIKKALRQHLETVAYIQGNKDKNEEPGCSYKTE